MKRVVLIAACAFAALMLFVWLQNFTSGADVDDNVPANPPSAAEVTRGAYIARAGNCATCHTDRGAAEFAGGRPLETPFGTVFSSNLTPDADTGLGRWSPSQFWRALHYGRSRDGRLLYPAFPYTHYTKVSRADSDALFDFLRSLTPVRKPNRAHELRWPYSTQAALAVWRTLYFRPGVYEEDTEHSPQWNRGAYLVEGLGHCGACHTARNALGATSRDLMDLSGGLIPMQNWYAPALTSPSEAGVRDWSDEEVVRLLQAGASPRATVLGPMAEVVEHSTQYLEAGDLKAMAVFLKALPVTPGASEVDPREVPRASEAVVERGAKLYADHCARCHAERGEGVRGAYPALAGNRAVLLPITANLVQVVLFGGFAPATQLDPRPFGMPPYALQLSDADVAAVLTFVRSSWGNRAAPVTEFDVARQRGTSQ
ncbi:MAG TPA: cytochrome c [Ramlibacter sp.]|nr:cytochrome c [Ramlibacter sp.]